MSLILNRIAAALCGLLLLTTLAFAQTPAGPDYPAWTDLADRAEDVVAADLASNDALETLRTDIAAFRQEFLNAQEVNSARIATLESQIEALGPVPEEGEEPTEIAMRRAELQQQLAQLRAPVLRAEEAFTRANGLIAEIDAIIRTRQTERLLDLGPTPLNPIYWTPAIEDLATSLARLKSELVTNWNSDAERATARQNLPLIIGLVLLAVLLVWRGPKWVRALVDQLRGATRPGTGVWSFLVSLGLILLPLGGLFALVEAAFASSMFGVRWQPLLDAVPYWAATLLLIRWLAQQTFSHDDDVATIQLEPRRRTEARYYVNMLSILIVARGIIEVLSTAEGYSPATAAVLVYPILVMTCLVLFRLGQILLPGPVTGEAGVSADASAFQARLTRLLARVLIAIAVAGPLLGGIGYTQVGEALVYPANRTLALIAALLVLQRFIAHVYELITGRNAQASESLVPVLAGACLLALASPILALIWGARVADLTELWARFQEGFTLGDARISPTDFLTFAVVFGIIYALTRLVQGGLRTSILPKTKIDLGGQNAIVSGVGYVGIFLAAIIAISSAGLDLSSVALVAGALSVGIGFGLQNIVQNFVSGIILLIERPISEGDWIEVGGNMGIVKDISVRSTRIETFDRTDVIVPNGDFVSGTVTNYTRGNTVGRVVVNVGVAYGSDTRRVEEILLRIVREHDMVLLQPPPSAYFDGFGADSLDFIIRGILRDVNYVVPVKSDILHSVYEKFAEEGIEIPFAQRDVWLRNPEALTQTRKGASIPRPESAPEETEPESEAPEQAEPTEAEPDIDIGSDERG